jgi:hypothetical protein
MSTTFTYHCDRCQQQIADGVYCFRLAWTNVQYPRERREVDLCHKCEDEFRTFMGKAGERRTQMPFTSVPVSTKDVFK